MTDHIAAPTRTTAPSTGLLIIVWLIVTVPAGWGVYQTAVKSLPLFSALKSGSAAPSSQPATAPTTMP